MSDSLEIALKALRGEKPRRVPVGTHLGGSWPFHRAGETVERLLGNPGETARIFYEVNEELDGDLLLAGTGATALTVRALGGEIRFNGAGAPSIVSEAVKEEGDLEGLDAESALRDPALSWILESAIMLRGLSRGRRAILASGRAPFTLAGHLYGIEKLGRALYRKKEFVHRLLEFTTKLSVGYFSQMQKTGAVHGAFVADPSASGDLISKKHFEEFAAPYLARVAEAVKVNGGVAMLHICGNVTDRLETIACLGFHSLSVESKVPIGKAARILAGRLSLAGNVDPVTVLEEGSVREVRAAAHGILNEGARKGGFTLLPGCDPSSRVPLENLKALVRAGHEWRG